MALLLFLTLNLSVPLYLRLGQPSIPLYARAMGFLEDIFIVLELFLLTAVSVWLAALVGLLIHLVLMLDGALFKQMQLKLRVSYLVHLQHAGSFYSSAKELGLNKLMGSALALLALHGVGYFVVYRHFNAAVSLWDGAIVLGIGAAAYLLSKRLPRKISYAVDNFFFRLQILQRKENQSLVVRNKNSWSNFGVKARIIDDRKLVRINAIRTNLRSLRSSILRSFHARNYLKNFCYGPLAISLKFPLEFFHPLDENYPLWRLTKGFEGEKQFDLKIDSREKPHVILLFLESFSSHAISYEKKATPHFDQLSQEGILFSNFYSNGTFTYRAMLAGLFGIAGGDTAKGLGPYVNVPYEGLPQLMKQAGYISAFFHNGSLSFDKQRDFLKNHFDQLADRSEIEDSPNTSTSWGAHDECLMHYTANWLEKQSSPAFMTLFTISNHHPWISPEHHVSPVFDSTLNLSHQRFLQTMHYTDHSLGLLMQLLREKNLSQKTVLVIVGDHSQPLGQHHGNFYYSRFLYEENVRVPLLIVADGRISEPKTIEDIGSHVDLLPTLMDLLHLQGVQHGCGTSLLRKHSERMAMLHNPYSEGFLGCRKGSWKWIENLLTQEGELYDVSFDPEEKNNQAAAFPDIAKMLQKETKEYFQHIYDLHRNQRIIPMTEGSSQPSEVNFDFSGEMLTDAELIQLALDALKMEKLILRDCLLITDVGVAAVLSKCLHLEELNLKGVTDVTDKAFELQAPRQRLRILHISEAAISDLGLEKLVRACPNLSVLSLLGKNLTDRGMQALSGCRHLVRLKILQADNISEEALIGVLRNNPHLGHLVLQGCKNLSDRTLEALQAHPLELLWILDAPQLTDEGIACLSKLPIRFLTLEGCPLLTDKSIASLKKLNLESAYLNCQGLVHL